MKMKKGEKRKKEAFNRSFAPRTLWCPLLRLLFLLLLQVQGFRSFPCSCCGGGVCGGADGGGDVCGPGDGLYLQDFDSCFDFDFLKNVFPDLQERGRAR